MTYYAAGCILIKIKEGREIIICTNCGNEKVSCEEYSSILSFQEQNDLVDKIYKDDKLGIVFNEDTYLVDKCLACYIPVGWQKFITDAPLCYDGFGTRTIKEIDFPFFHRTCRIVIIAPENINWQTMRYSSGMKIALTLERALAEFDLVL